MSNLEMWALIVGFILPPILAVVQQPGWAKPVRALVTAVACVAAGIITELVRLNGHWNWDNWLQTTLTIGVAAIAFYHGTWKPTGIAPGIERSTSHA